MLSVTGPLLVSLLYFVNLAASASVNQRVDLTLDESRSMQGEPSAMSTLPRVDISEQKYLQKAREARRVGDEKKYKKYTRFLKTLRRGYANDFHRVQDHYIQKQEKVISELAKLDYRLGIVKRKEAAFIALAAKLSELPPNHLPEAARKAALLQSDLQHFHRHLVNVEMIQKKIEEYIEEMIYGGERKRFESTWEDEYLYLLRDEAMDLVDAAAVNHFDLVGKYEILDELMKKYEKGIGKTSKERIDYKREKADLLLDALLYSRPEPASNLALRCSQKEIKIDQEEKVWEAKLAKARAKALAWSSIDMRRY